MALLFFAALFATGARAQIINTIAGNAINDGKPALETTLGKPQGLAFDSAGNLIIADRANFVVRRISAVTGISTVLAGGGSQFDDAIPIPGRSAALDFPLAMAVDANNNIYFSDFNDHRIRKITPGGQISTIAGTGEYGYSGDGGKAVLATLAFPVGVALDRAGNLYIADADNAVVRRVNLSTGIIQTVAGIGNPGNSGDGGPADRAQLQLPWALAFSADGSLYISDLGEDIVRKVSPAGIITTEVPKSAGISGPRALAFSPSGALHIADYSNDRVVRVDAGGTLTPVAGGGFQFATDNIPAIAEFLFGPTGLAFDGAGNLFISLEGFSLVRRVDAASRLSRTFAGTLNVLDGGPALNAPLAFPVGIAVDPSGNILFVDEEHQRIRRIDASPNPAQSTIRTIVGTGFPDSAPDGTLASSASAESPLSVSVDSSGNIYYTEAFTVVRKIDAASGRVTTVAGRVYEGGYSGDRGPAVSAQLNIPFAAVPDRLGNLYISDRDNHCIRRVDSRGTISTAAGVCTQPGYTGDGGLATQARLNHPTGLAFDLNGNLLIADQDNYVVRRLNVTTDRIERVAGKGGVFGYSGDGGSPLEAELGTPIGLAVDRNGNIYIADDSNEVVRVIRGNTISTFAGVGISGFAGDGGRAEFAFLNTPTGLAVDAAGNLYISDSDNHRIRRVSAQTDVAPVLAVEPNSLSFRVPQGSAPAAQAVLIKNTGSGLLFWSAEAATVSGGPWLRLSDNAGSAPASLKALVNTRDLAVGTYQGAILISGVGAANSPARVAVSLTVDPPLTPELALSTQFLTFDAIQGGAPPTPQILSITNSGSGDLNWSAQAITNRGGNWLSVAPASGSVGTTAGSTIVSVNAEGLATGLYLGLLTVNNTGTGATKAGAVSLSVGPPAGRILMTQSNFAFTVVQGSTVVPPQPFRIVNAGEGSMEWRIQTILPQGNWLRVSQLQGTSDAAAPRASPVVSLAVDASELSPGTYGGLLVVSAAGARNNPQFATVVTRVLPPGSAPVPSVQPAGLIFTTTPGGSPTVQEVNAQTTGGGSLTFTAGARTEQGVGWLTVSPTSGSLQSSADRTRVRIQVSPATLAAGVYRGAVTLSFSDGSVLEVAVAAIVREGAAASPASAGKTQNEPCAPARQVLVSTRLANNFSLPTGWPVPMAVQVSNDCGVPVANSTVAASFSSGDAPIVLHNLRDGQYAGTWVPARAPSPAAPEVQVFMRSLNPQLQEGALQLSGKLGLDTTYPVINDNGVVNGASFASVQPLSPGGIFSLFGSSLADRNSFAGEVPLPTTLGGVSVKIGGLDAPLFFAGPGQINGQIPPELADAPSADIVVTARGIVSAQRTIQLHPTQPGIFFTAGETQGAVLNQDFSANSPANPAARGAVIQIFASGLGPTSPSVPAGAPAPTTAPFANVTNPVTVTIGGINAPVEFQALAPGFVGLYQINAQIPAGITPGPAVPLRISQNGFDSNPVTVAVR
ncbi:MAG: hypothetical protein A3H28_15780 [Acidobacteria bacterium RIFCSPLOWO2_02_FULL_61_28]|nr:MAG: hypothetical protein A3H28_15780 [Acidobacteria bacterium RIFCSPLOWO2_02_FULL_61_28]